MPEIKQQRWKIVEYSKRQINDAGNIIRKDNTTAEELAFATQVIDNWRAAHAYPMHVIYIHLRRMAAPRNDILVVERLKRLDSIIGKLRRETRMDLWRMQDLGGCRFITPSVDEVFHFAEEYKKSRVRHEYKRTYLPLKHHPSERILSFRPKILGNTKKRHVILYQYLSKMTIFILSRLHLFPYMRNHTTFKENISSV